VARKTSKATKTKQRGVAFRDLPRVMAKLARDAETVLRDLYDAGRG
jgi:hypothetical protein